MRKRSFRASVTGRPVLGLLRTVRREKQGTTLVDVRGTNLSDAGSIPAISTFSSLSQLQELIPSGKPPPENEFQPGGRELDANIPEFSRSAWHP